MRKPIKEWNAVFLENQYLKIMILPELGGRVQMAYDKTRQRHFIYYNQVIKPALVGLTGPWISGGLEFNWPQHHRPSTFDPVDHCIEENEDGSVTVWCSEVERMFRTRGMAGFTLHPDKAYLEIKVKLYNRTNLRRRSCGGPIRPSRSTTITSRYFRPMCMPCLTTANAMCRNIPLPGDLL
jgi:hypothetical protein